MATALNVIRTLTLRAVTEGFDQATRALGNLAGAQENVAKTAVTMERATLSSAAAANKVQASLDPAFRAQQKMAQVQKELSNALNTGAISQSRYSELMQLAMVRHNTAGAAAQKHSQALKELSGVAEQLGGNLGALGGILARMGPAGLAAAGVIGGLGLAMFKASTAALDFADRLGKMVDTADSVGITVRQLQALEKAGAQVGLSSEQVGTALEKFNVSLGKLRTGDKEAFEAFEQLGEGMAKNVANSNTVTEAFNKTAGALVKLDTAGKAFVGSAIFGRGQGAGIGRLAGEIDKAGGSVNKLADSMDQATFVSRQQAEALDALGDKIKQTFKDARDQILLGFAGPQLEVLDKLSTLLLEVAKAARPIIEIFAKLFSAEITGRIDAMTVALNKFKTELERMTPAEQRQAFLDQLIDPRLVQAIERLINIIGEATTVILKFIEVLRALSEGNLPAAEAAAQGVLDAFSRFKDNISGLRSVLDGTQAALEKGADSWEGWGDQVTNADNAAGKLKVTIKNNTFAPPPEAEQRLQGTAKLWEANEKAAKKTKDATKEAMEALGQAAGQLGSALVQAFLNGDNAAKALQTTLRSIGSQAAGTAINKLVTGDFTGAAVSGAISIGASLLSFLFGDDEEEQRNQQEVARQQQEAAQRAAQLRQALEDIQPRIRDFERSVSGLAEGTLPAAIRELNQSAIEFTKVAAAAGSATETARIQDALGRGIQRLLDKFAVAVPDLLAEFGKATQPVAAAQQSVEDLRQSFEDFKASLIDFGSRVEDTAGTVDRLAILTGRYQEGLLNLIGLEQPISETAQEVERLTALSAEVTKALVELGIAAEDAAAMVDQRLNKVLVRMREDFMAPLVESINEFVGGDWINQGEALIAQVKQLNADAVALGVDAHLVQTFYVIEAQKIINSTQLVGDQFHAFTRWLGISETELHEFNAALEDTANTIKRTAAEITSAVQANEDRLFNAIHRSDSLQDQLLRFDLAAQREREQEIAAGGEALASLEAALMQERTNIINDFLQQQIDEAERVRQEQIDAAKQAAEERARLLQEAADFIQSQVRRISDWIAAFLAGPQSTLPPSQQLAQAQAHFASERALAASGNRDALSNITTAAQTLVDATRRYYGSAAPGQAIIQNLLGQLQALPSQLTPEEFIVNELKPPIEDIPGDIVPPITNLQDVLTILLNNLKLAVEKNNSQAIAAALLPMFDMLDTTMDGALSFQELLTGLGSTFSTGTLRAIFTELDGNGNGLLEKSELIKIATGKTDVNTDTANDLQTIANNTLNSINNAVVGIVQLNSRLIEANDHLFAIRRAQNQQNIFWGQPPGAVSLFTFAKGGPITPMRMGPLMGRLHAQGGIPMVAEGGEYVVNRHDARWARPFLDAINFGHGMPTANDNGVAIVPAIARLERSLIRGVRAIIETQLEAAGIISEPIEDANKLQRTRRAERKNTG